MVDSVLRPPSLLLASHHAEAGRELKALAEQQGYAVHRAYSGIEALDQAQGVHPDLIVLDESLPDIDVLDVSRALRDDREVGPSTPILLITAGRPTTAEHHAALRVGIWEYLSHPFHVVEIATKLQSYVLLKRNADRGRGAERVTDEAGMYTDRGLALRVRELALQAFHHSAPLACVVFAPLVAAGRSPGGPVAFVARVLRATSRRSDAIGRVGEAELALMAAGTDRIGAVLLAHRLDRAVRAASPGAPLLRAGYEAVDNARATPIEPGQLVSRAVQALATARAGAQADWIQAYRT